MNENSHEKAQMSTSNCGLGNLTQFIQARQGAVNPAEDFEEFERELHQMIVAVECEVLAQELRKYDVDEPFIVVNDVVHHKVIRCEETYTGSAGAIRVERSLYSSRREKERALCPLEIRAGIIEGRWTPLAAKQASWVVAHMTPGEGEQLFGLLGGMSPSKSSLDRLPKKLSERWELGRREFEIKLRAQERVPDGAVTIGIGLDGVMAPMKDGKRQQKREFSEAKGQQAKGPNGYQEVGCATVSFYDEEGERLSTIRMGRMPEQKKETLKEMITAQLHAALGERPDLVVVKMADGAKDNWSFLSDELDYVSGHEVLDYFHAAQHLSSALGAAYGDENLKKKSQYEKLRIILRDEKKGVEKVIRSLVHLRDKYPRRKKILTELKYFRANRHRMAFAEMKDQNLPIGTGVTEAACKTLVSQRLKRSGMRWRHPGGQAILTFRSMAQSDRFERFWRILTATYKSSAPCGDNVVSFKSENHSINQHQEKAA